MRREGTYDFALRSKRTELSRYGRLQARSNLPEFQPRQISSPFIALPTIRYAMPNGRARTLTKAARPSPVSRCTSFQSWALGYLAALVPVLIGDANEGLFTPATAFSRQRVHKVFHDAVVGATDAPRPEVAAALGRLLYLVHLAIILWWLLEKSPRQRATTSLIALVRQVLPAWAPTLRLPQARAIMVAGDSLFREALFDDSKPQR